MFIFLHSELMAGDEVSLTKPMLWISESHLNALPISEAQNGRPCQTMGGVRLRGAYFHAWTSHFHPSRLDFRTPYHLHD